MHYKGIEIHTGLDVHSKTWAIKSLSPNLTPKPVNMSDPSPEKLLNHMEKKFPGGTYIFAYEAGFSGFDLARKLNIAGHTCLVVNPADIPTTGKEKLHKTDPVDASKIAVCLKANQLKSIHIPTEALERDRSVMNRRQVIAKKRRRVMAQLKSRLHYRGFKTENTNWSKAFLLEVKELAKKDDTLEEFIHHYEYFNERLKKARKKLKALSQSKKYKVNYDRIVKLKGVGLITAMFYLTRVGDINRFENEDKYCSFFGIIPGVNNSGEKERSRGMTNRCNKELRSMLVQCSWAFARGYPKIAAKYENLCKRMIPSKAIIRITKTLIKTIRAILISGEEPNFSIA